MILQKYILILEDERLEQELLTAQIKEILHNDFEILLSNNGIQALDICQKHCPSILFVDINIPGLNGLSFINTLKQFHYPGKIIITTAYDLFDYAKQAIDLNVDGYLLKPVDDKELKDAIEICLNNLKEEERQSLEIQAAFSYAESYLVNDLLSGNIPSNTLKRAFSWPADGALQVRFLQFRANGENSDQWKSYFINRCRELFSKNNLLLAAKVGLDVIILIQPKKVETEDFLDTN